MSLFQSLTAGVSGLKSQASKLNVISDNIANVNTVGYKGGIANFQTLVNGFSANTYSAGGVAPGHQQTNQKTGIISATDSATDLAIAGRGFFPVSDAASDGGLFYTRAGSFSKNLNGDYLNTGGYFLKGWRLDVNGDLPPELTVSSLTQSAAEAALETINVDNISLEAVPTTSVILKANLKSSEVAIANNSIHFSGSLIDSQTTLPTTSVAVTTNLQSTTAVSSVVGYDPLDDAHNMASEIVTPSYTVPLILYDDAGTERTGKIGYLKTAANTWAVEVYADDIVPAVGAPANLIASGTLTFNSDGTLATVSPALIAATAVDWGSPISTSTLTFGFGTVAAADGMRESTDAYSGIAAARPDYNPAVAATSVASGLVTPHYSSTITVTDNTGTARDVVVNFLKIAADTWDIEITASPAASLNTATGGVPDQIAYGTVTFDAGGALDTISSSLSSPIAVDWVGTTEINNIQFDWGTLSGVAGLGQLNAVGAVFSSSPTVVENYAPEDVLRNMASGEVVPHFNRTIDVVDNGGTLRTLNISALKTGTNIWAVEIYAEDAADVALPTAQIAHGIITFNGDGTLASITASLSDPIDVEWISGGPSTITFDLGTAGPIAGTAGATVTGLADGLSQLNSANQVRSITQNGNVAGENATVSVDENGFLIGSYTNGSIRKLYKIPLAEFISPDRLAAVNGNVFLQTSNSGTATYFQASQAEQSVITGNALETSNVDVTAELTNMMIAQRSYQSNSKLITTTDNLLDVLFKM